MNDVDIDRIRFIVKCLSDFETLDEYAEQYGLGTNVISTALNPDLSKIVMQARDLRHELEVEALNIARKLVEVIDG